MDASIETAIKSAKYNEAIVVSVTSDPSKNPEEIVLVAQLDEVNGGITWNPLQATDDNNEDIGIVQHLKTKRWVLPMLNDSCRNSLYNEAIQKASEEVLRRFKQSMNSNDTSSSKSPIRVLDIGSGSGLLAMMAAHHLQEQIQHHSECEAELDDKPQISVTSLEMSSAMARLARQTLASNELENTVEVVETISYDFSLEQKAHFCTSELLESGLLGEGVLPALRDAWERLLHPDAVVVPQRARVFAQVLEGCDCIGKYWGPHLVNNETLRLSLSTDEIDVMLGDAHGGIIVPIHSEMLFAPNGDCELKVGSSYARRLCDPIDVFEFSFSNHGIPDPSGRCQTTTIVPTRSGTAHGVLFWWELELWDDLVYSTECAKQKWQDHWQQCLYVFPTPNSECPKLVEGQPISLVVNHSDSRISFAISSEGSEPNVPCKRRRSESVKGAISPQRAFQLNDSDRTAAIRASVAFALAQKGVESIVLDLSDFSLCGILAALEGARNVVSVESSTGTLSQASARVAQANGLPRTGASFQILNCYPEQLTKDAIAEFGQAAVDVVVAEPYYEVLEGWHLQEAMNFFFLLKALRSRGIVSETASVVPAYASIKGAAFSCADLWSAYTKCGDGSDEARVCGFKHDVVNSFGVRFEEHDIHFPCWQYNIVKLTDSFELGRLHYEHPGCVIHGKQRSISVPFTKAGVCHGLMTWMEYGLRISDDTRFRCISTDDRSHQQAIRFLTSPVVVNESGLEKTRFECNASFGERVGHEYHSFRCCVRG